jgi:gas vesicle protein
MSKDIITEALETLPASTSATSTETNVHGWERAGSIAGGAMLVGKGVRRGGFLGLIQIALGGVALARGFTGRSKTKSLIAKGREELDGLRGNIERAGDQLKELTNSAVDKAKDVKDTALDKAKDVKDTALDKAKDVKHDAEDKARKLKDNAEAATDSATVTGNDSLNSPKL